MGKLRLTMVRELPLVELTRKAIMRKAQQIIKCDGYDPFSKETCDEKIVKRSKSMDRTKKTARKLGWTIGKYDFCPRCNNK